MAGGAALAEWKKLVADGEALLPLQRARRPGLGGSYLAGAFALGAGWSGAVAVSLMVGGPAAAAVAFVVPSPFVALAARRHRRRMEAWIARPPFAVTWGSIAARARSLRFDVQLGTPDAVYRAGVGPAAVSDVERAIATVHGGRPTWVASDRVILEVPAEPSAAERARELLYYFVRPMHAAYPVRSVVITVDESSVPRG